MVTSYTGAVEQDELHYPWGQEWTMMGSMKEERYARLHHRDCETSSLPGCATGGLDPTHFRTYSSDQGRWMTPDPSSEGSSSPFSPQTWNRYAYVTGNPLKLFDPFGLGSCDNMGYNRGSWCGGDNGGPNCFRDGMYTPCNTVKSAVQRGFAVGCGNSCGPTTVYEGNLTAIQSCNATTEGWSCTQTPPTYLGTSLQQFQAGYYGQLGANVAAMEAMGVNPTDIGNFIGANNNPDWASVQLGGGNFDFPYSPMYTGVSCAFERCDLGSLGTLDFSHNNGTVHLDTCDPHSGIRQAACYVGNDIIGGNGWWGSGIPR